MTQPPRRLPPTHDERVKVTIDRMAGGSDGGSTRFARPVPGLSAASARSVPRAPVFEAVRVADLGIQTPDVGAAMSIPIVNYDGLAFYQSVTGSVRAVAGEARTLGAFLDEKTAGYQITYCEVFITDSAGANMRFLATGVAQPVAMVGDRLYFGDPPEWAGGSWTVGAAITDDPDYPGFGFEFTATDTYHFRITLAVERI